MIDVTPPLDPPRVVKPRQPHTLDMVIVTCDRSGRCWYEGAPKIKGFDVVGVVRYLRNNWPVKDGRRRKVMFVAHNPMRALVELEAAFARDPEWQVRITISEGQEENVDECTFYRAERQRVAYFGFRDTKRHTKYLYAISPLEFMEDYHNAQHQTETVGLYHFGGSLRRFLQENNLRFSASKGGISAQLLRDRKFYPHNRRKIPLLTNEAVRPALPGNCYQMTASNTERFFNSVYIIDQENAHHWAAQNVTLPDADQLFAHGWYWLQEDAEWISYRDRLFEEILSEHGLFRVRASIPARLSGYVPPWARAHGEGYRGGILADIWLYSNEIALARSLGIELRHLSYWYSSPVADHGIPLYAEWAERQVAGGPDQKKWLKPLLLSAYGILGARPRYMESAYRGITKGDPHTYILGGHPFTYQKVKSTKRIQSPVANLLHRGMIEAETRKLSIELARQFETEGHNVVGIHADAILVEDVGQQLPLLPPPWRVKDRLSRFKALDPVSFESDELEILPGRPRHAKR